MTQKFRNWLSINKDLFSSILKK